MEVGAQADSIGDLRDWSSIDSDLHNVCSDDIDTKLRLVLVTSQAASVNPSQQRQQWGFASNGATEVMVGRVWSALRLWRNIW
eukprot:2771893-Rhodomonas_salina.3